MTLTMACACVLVLACSPACSLDERQVDYTSPLSNYAGVAKFHVSFCGTGGTPCGTATVSVQLYYFVPTNPVPEQVWYMYFDQVRGTWCRRRADVAACVCGRTDSSCVGTTSIDLQLYEQPSNGLHGRARPLQCRTDSAILECHSTVSRRHARLRTGTQPQHAGAL